MKCLSSKLRTHTSLSSSMALFFLPKCSMKTTKRMFAASKTDAAVSVAVEVVDAVITTPTTTSVTARTPITTVDTTIIVADTIMTEVVTTTGEVTTTIAAAMRLRLFLLPSPSQASMGKAYRLLHQDGSHLRLLDLRLGAEMEGHRYRHPLAVGVHRRKVMRHRTRRCRITGPRTKFWGTMAVAGTKDEEAAGAGITVEAGVEAEAVAGMVAIRGTEAMTTTTTAGFSMTDGGTSSPRHMVDVKQLCD